MKSEVKLEEILVKCIRTNFLNIKKEITHVFKHQAKEKCSDNEQKVANLNSIVKKLAR